jgi:hypothetical protein
MMLPLESFMGGGASAQQPETQQPAAQQPAEVK